MSNNNSNYNSKDILSYNEYIPSSSKMNINRHLSLYSPSIKESNQNILNTYLNSNKLTKKENKSISVNKKRGKSIANNLSSNNPSTLETSLSNSLFDLKSPQLKNLNISGISFNKILVHLRPKSDNNKIKLDIILGSGYFLSKQNQNKKKIEKFIYKTQKKFDDKMDTFREEISQKVLNSIKINSMKDNININNINDEINMEIKIKTKIFHKFENMMAIFSLIIYHLIKVKKKNEAKIIYLLIIKQNIKHMKYLENVINFNDLLNDKYGKHKIKMYRYGYIVLLKVYSILLKYGFFFNLSLYGNLFTKIYLNFSQKYFIYSLSNQKIKYSPFENIKLAKNWFAYLNHYSAYFCLYNYIQTKIPINLYNSALTIINSIDERNYDLYDKDFILSTKYNKSLLLYINGESDEAINTLKNLKNNLFNYITANFTENNNKKNAKSKSVLSPELSEQIQQKTGKTKENLNKNFAVSFNKIFNQIIQGKNIKNKQSLNINSKFESFFVSNIPINIEDFVNKYLDICGISSNNNQNKPIKQKLSFVGKIKKIAGINNNTKKQSSSLHLNNIEKPNKINIPKIFQMPILIRAELLMAEIELDRKHYRAAYTFTNHALAIISIFRKLQNEFLLSKFSVEQKYIKEFLNIIDNSNMITESDNEEEEEEKEKEKDSIKYMKDKEYVKLIEFKERITLNKKILKELEKFFIFFMNLSIYQIKILNDTQPKAKIKDFLPILFQNQFKDCLSLKQNISLENLDIMSLSRYMILKDPNKLILPENLNISSEYMEKPELFKSHYVKKERKKTPSEQKEEALLNQKANEIFRQIIKNIKDKTRLVMLLKNNHDLVLKIIKNSNKTQIKKLLENPESLIIPIEKWEYKRNNPIDFSKRDFKKKKSQIIGNNFFSGVKTDANRGSKKDIRNLFHKSFQKSLYNDMNKIKSRTLKTRNSLDKSEFFSRNKLRLNSLNKKKKNIDSYSSSYKLSIIENLSDSD